MKRYQRLDREEKSHHRRNQQETNHSSTYENIHFSAAQNVE